MGQPQVTLVAELVVAVVPELVVTVIEPVAVTVVITELVPVVDLVAEHVATELEPVVTINELVQVLVDGRHRERAVHHHRGRNER